MAIDNAEKRRSVSGIAAIPLGPAVTPNVSKDAEWRQQATWGYGGIAVEPPEEGGNHFDEGINMSVSISIGI